jgi:hypothetical protein
MLFRTRRKVFGAFTRSFHDRDLLSETTQFRRRTNKCLLTKKTKWRPCSWTYLPSHWANWCRRPKT